MLPIIEREKFYIGKVGHYCAAVVSFLIREEGRAHRGLERRWIGSRGSFFEIRKLTEKRRGSSRFLLLLNVSRNVSKNTSIIVSINVSILISILVFLLISILTFIPII